MMQAVTQNKKLKPNSPWRALELLFDSSRLWVEARNCFLIEMSKDRKMQVNEMIEMMQSKQTISQVRNVKQWKAIRKPIANTSNLFRGSSHCSTSPPSPLWRISTKFTKEIFTPEPLHPRGLQLVYTRPEYPTLTNPTSIQEGSQHKEIQVTGWSKDHKLSLTTSYRVEMIFGSRSEVRKILVVKK